ncbi:MAG: NADH:ubiquinone oxidoreductase [Proteobacteria bacterium]|nr:NADH:ubiquinone oxidoreductase [Pseudomonadota bacterium]
MEKGGRSYLGVEIKRPRVAFFELSSCEGCQLQILNNEASLLSFLSLVEIVNFREAMSIRSDDYEIAFVEGSVTRADEEERLKRIRKRAGVLVALGSCACFGGVNQLKNRFNDLEWVKHEVYGDHPVETREVQPLSAFVEVDLSIYGCPVKKEEVEQIVTNLVLGKSVDHPRYPVCMECTAKGNTCLFELGEPCLGPITRAGCDSWCPDNRMGCWGCRGPADEANIIQFREVIRKHNIPEEVMLDRMECFGGFRHILKEMKGKQDKGQME